jgi:hypothetical protein
MGPRGKILTSLLLIIIVIIAVWQFTSPALIPSVGTKYLSSTLYANRGSWVVLEVSGYGKVFLVFSIANLTYPRTTLPTSYSLIVSKVNETALPFVHSRIYRQAHRPSYPRQLRRFHLGLGTLREFS